MSDGRTIAPGLWAVLWLCAPFLPAWGAEPAKPAPTVQDAIEMVRVQNNPARDGRLGTFSPDGRLFAFVTWQGDLVRNTNIYHLIVADPGEPGAGGLQTILTREFAGDPENQNATPIEQPVFLEDNRTLAYIGLDAAGVRQVFAVDVQTKSVRQLTHHPTDVMEFAVNAQGDVRFFSAVAVADEETVRTARLEGDGVFLADRELFNPAPTFKAGAVLGMRKYRKHWVRQYFFIGPKGSALAYDSRQSRRPNVNRSFDEEDRGFSIQLSEEDTLRKFATLIGSAKGGHALMFPYAPADLAAGHEDLDASGASAPWMRKLEVPYALVDLTAGRIESLSGVTFALASSASGGGPPVWRADGRAVVVFGAIDGKAAQWVEVDTPTLKIQPLTIAAGWRVLHWDSEQRGLVLAKDNRIATLQRAPGGTWGEIRELGVFEHLNWRWTPVSNGRVLIGLFEGPASPPELMALDLETRRLRALTDLNPQLRDRSYGKTHEFHWSNRYNKEASGFLVYPQAHRPTRRYPLVVLLDDGTLKRIAQPYLLDGFMQFNGHAVQMIAAQDMMVLYTREPASLIDASAPASECERMREHVESAIGKLDEMQLIDPDRVGLSGWSRAAYHTDCILIHGQRRLAAATRMDGGGVEFIPKMRPYSDEELQRIATPLLIESHGLYSLVRHTGMADRLETFGRPTEVLYFPSAPHSTLRPRHRLRSLQTHIDWWRFWLKDEESNLPANASQYSRWRKLREMERRVRRSN